MRIDRNDTSSRVRLPSLELEEFYAALDLGSNTCRALIAQVNNDTYKVVDSYSKVIRLGLGVRSSRMLAPSTMDRALSALKECAKKIQKYRVTRIRGVATEACRQAQNRDILLQRILDETGLQFEVIPEAEEARLALLGCTGLIKPSFSNVLAFDIGGGSTEVMWAKVNQDLSTEVIDWLSMPYGVVSINEACGGDTNPFYEDICARISGEVGNLLNKHDIINSVKSNHAQVIGSSGTTTTVSAINLGLKTYERDLVDGSNLSLAAIKDIALKLRNMSIRERAQHPCIGLTRSDLVLGGIAILEGICEAGQIKNIQVADRGLRDGILADMLTQRQKLSKESKEQPTAA